METIGKIFLLCLVALATDAKKTRLSDLAPAANPGEFPFQVAIHLDGRFHCGGALISKTHVLTAAHCVKPMTTSPFTLAQRVVIQVGSVRLGSGESHRVARAAYHKRYSDDPYEQLFIPNDIGLITLKTPVTESSTVGIISLPSAGTIVSPGSSVTIAGFGASQPRGPVSQVLKKDTFTVITTAECNQYYQPNLRRTITSSHICAKSRPGYGTCNGDSGGPLVQNNQVVGVVSGGDGQCATGSPDVYTNVGSYVDWIRTQMNVKPGSSNGQGGPGVLPPAGNPFPPAGNPFPPQQIPPVGNPFPPQQIPPGWNPYPGGQWNPFEQPQVVPVGQYPEYPNFDPNNPYQPEIIYQ